MFQLLPPWELLPSWEAMHPLVIHSPIGFFLAATVFVALAVLFPRAAGWPALLLLALGTGGAFYAVTTGEAARDIVEDGPDPMWEVLERHEELAVQTRNLFLVLTIVYAVIVIAPLVWKKAARAAVQVPVQLLFLVLLLGGNALLANAAHLGGHLVHVYGIRAPVGEIPLSSEEEATSSQPDTEAESSAESAADDL